jgi:hypothetical protein
MSNAGPEQIRYARAQAALGRAACVAYAQACVNCCQDANTTHASCSSLCQRYEACKKDFQEQQNTLDTCKAIAAHQKTCKSCVDEQQACMDSCQNVSMPVEDCRIKLYRYQTCVEEHRLKRLLLSKYTSELDQHMREVAQ